MSDPANTADAAGNGVPRTALIVAGVACASVIVSHIFGRFSYSILLPAIRDDLVDSFTGAGFLGFSYFAGYMIGVISVTLLSLRVEPITFMRAGLALSVVALGGAAVARSLITLALAIALAGLAGAGIWVPAPTVATAAMPARYRGVTMGALTASMGVGMLAVSQGTTLARAAADDESLWRPIFATEALVTLVILLAAVLLVARTRAVRPQAHESRFTTADLRTIPHWKQLTVAYTLFSLLAGSWTQFMGVALEQDAGLSRAHINNLFSLLAVAAIPGALGLGRLSDRIGRDRAIAIAAMLTAVASVLLIRGGTFTTAVAAFTYGAGSFGVPPLVAAAFRDHLEGRSFAMAFGSVTVLYSVGSMIASQTAGVLADARGSFTLVYAVLGGVAVVVAVVALNRAASLRAIGRDGRQ